MSANGPARALQFENLEEALAEAWRLHEKGYALTGNWTLAQVCGHCANWLRFTYAGGYPRPLWLRPVLLVVSRTIGPALLRKTIREGRMPARGPTVPATIPRAIEPASMGAGHDKTFEQRLHQMDAAAVEELASVIAEFRQFTGEIARSPVFGEMDKETAEQLHRVHLAHHLGFLVPDPD